MSSTQKIKDRMQYIFANSQLQEEILRNLIKSGLREGAPCPCPDCNETLQQKSDGYTKLTKDNKMVAVEFDVFFCSCGYQGRKNQEGSH